MARSAGRPDAQALRRGSAAQNPKVGLVDVGIHLLGGGAEVDGLTDEEARQVAKLYGPCFACAAVAILVN
jgi:hypothetical protein